MNSETNSKMRETQSNKPASYKRAHRANRPVLITGQDGTGLDKPTAQAIAEATQPEVAVETAEPVTRKRRPGFFLNIGKAENKSDQRETDPKAARMARAMRGKVVDAPVETVKEKKSAVSAPKAGSNYTSARPKSGFKTKYLLGMMAYLLIADFLGVWITDWMVANHLDGPVFKLGALVANRSTLVFLALLVVILVLMARFDFIPRSFSSMMSGGSSAGRGPASKGSAAKAPTFETKASQPAVKQGVQGKDDELYKEYRENQRYFQKRDRKR